MENLFNYYIKTEDFLFKYAKGEPEIKEREFHHFNEFVFFIEGKSYLISKNVQQELTPGSVIMIPKEHFHQFRVSEPQNYVRCVLGFYDDSEMDRLLREIMNAIKVIVAPKKEVLSVFENLIEIVKSDLSDEEKRIFIKTSIVQLLIYFKKYDCDTISKSVNLSQVVSNALGIIDEKYTEKLTLKYIAQKLYISESTLSHKFSKELNISVYRYITQKRLSFAHNLILHGETLTNAALRSGFNDYSCFYRLYNKSYKARNSNTNE